eukprot:symbB.v1.2.031415.t2/scaffold3643.1/size52769/7
MEWKLRASCYILGLLNLFAALLTIFTAGSFEPKTITAALDTGTSLICIPADDFESVAIAMFGTKLWLYCEVLTGNLVCLCDIQNDVRPLGFEVGGKTFWLRPSEMFINVGKVDGRDICYTGLATGFTPMWILGDVFLRQAFVVHSYNRKEMALFPYAPNEVLAETLLEAPMHLSVLSGLSAILAVSLAISMTFCKGNRQQWETPLLEPLDPRDSQLAI